MPFYLKLINVALLATVKFFYAPIYAFLLGLGFWESLISFLSGGIFSLLAFYFATDIFLIYVKHLKPVIVFVTPHNTRLRYQNWTDKRFLRRKQKKHFTRKNRFFVKIRTRWGMWGIVLATPIILSIPLGAFLLRKYYGHRKIALPLALLALIVEGFLFNIIYWFFMNNAA